MGGLDGGKMAAEKAGNVVNLVYLRKPYHENKVARNASGLCPSVQQQQQENRTRQHFDCIYDSRDLI